MRPYILTLIFSISFLLPIAAQPKDSVAKINSPFFAGIHFAGNTGFLAVSFGKKFFNDHLVLGVGYGYLPKEVNDVEVHSFFLKTSYNFSNGLLYKKAKWYIGFSTIYGITNNTFIKLPSYYPDDYYSANAIHFSPYLGLRLPFFYKPTWASRVNFHTELGMLDTYLWYSIISEQITFWDICNISFGLYYDL